MRLAQQVMWIRPHVHIHPLSRRLDACQSVSDSVTVVLGQVAEVPPHFERFLSAFITIKYCHLSLECLQTHSPNFV